MGGSSKQETVIPEKKFGEASDYIQYNPEAENATNFFRGSIGAGPTSTFDEFMSRQAPGVIDFFSDAQGPMEQSLTDRANRLSEQGMSKVASQYGGLNAAYSRGANKAIAEAGMQPFADVNNQLGMQQLNLGGSIIGQGLSNAYSNEGQRLGAYAGMAAPQYYNPYTYQGAQVAQSGNGNGMSSMLGGAGVGASVGGVPGAFIGGALGGLGSLFF